MDLDLIYVAEMLYRRKEKQNEEYDAVDYYDTYDERAEIRNIKRANAKYYDSYESRFNY